MITRRVTAPRKAAFPTVAPPPVATPVDQVLMYKGHQIEAGSYCVGSVSWSPRAVVSVKNDEGMLEQAEEQIAAIVSGDRVR